MTTSSTAAPSTTLTVCCPCCGEREAEVDLQLWTGNLHCTHCDNEFTRDDLRAIMAEWAALLSWLGAMPGTRPEA